MRNSYSPWAELSERPEIELKWKPLAGSLLGQYVHDLRRIHLDPCMSRRQARSVLCHELRHADTADEQTECATTTLRQEIRANRIAAKLLVDIEDLGDAMVLHNNHLSAMAVELRVSDAILAVRRDYLTRTEQQYLRRRMREVA
ncbi:ImmA/IrrE family metallo-endopeptidase [Nocardioides sp. BP30]|uniref:ImmA/IrrE family metallo-endopeptidase n=1 Tax=Nocardioides sp. BP30 TaxID=3036374 RepID=UPI00246892DA|nr:ImmA/IrrE family metallo-endopeptidase [Nocardioides sp. BP30]WGL50676.1 ImmA/IrrE family metallo-endopeptidase [Nocardioides sp. BP30]